MAGRFGHISVTKSLVILGCGATAAVVSYFGWKKLQRSFMEEKDEGFEDVSKQLEDAPEKKVLVLGLDGAGKSCILAALGQQDEPNKSKPTEGFNVMCVQTEKQSLNIWEIGGAEKMRQYWTNFIVDTCLLAFVVDSSDDEKRLSLAFDEFHKLLGDDRLKNIPLVIVAAKQDLEGAKSPSEIQHSLGLDNMNPREHFVQAVGTAVPPSAEPRGITQLQQLLSSLSA